MIKKLPIMYIMIFLHFLIIQCSIVEPEKKDSNVYKIKGIVFDNVEIDSFYISGAKIQIKDIECFSDNVGEFYIQQLESGVYNLKIDHPEYYNLDTLVNINRSYQKIYLKLRPILGDYFPLKEGNEWVYSYKNSIISPDSKIVDLIIYNQKLKVKKLIDNGLSLNFTIHTTNNGIKVHKSEYSGRNDTTLIETEFKILGTFECNQFVDIIDEGESVIDLISKRYYPISRGDTLELDKKYGYQQRFFVKDIGLYFFEYKHFGMNFYYTSFYLIDYSLN